MTRRRLVRCDNPNCPHEVLLQFSDWSREKLPDSSSGFTNNDIDYVFWNYKTRRLMLIEVKTRKGNLTKSQSELFPLLDSIIKNGIQKIVPSIDYRGFHCVRFENTGFNDGRCMFDDKIVSEEYLIKILSME